MARQIELNPVSHMTIGTVGPPGQRIFYLQGSRGIQTISLVIEKEQAIVLANSFNALLEELEKRYPRPSTKIDDTVWLDMRLREPVEPLFRVGNMGVGYNEDSDQVVLVTYELVPEDEEIEPDVVSFWATRTQIKTVIQHVAEVVRAGRPICGNCGRPIDPDGHFCPNRNGHLH